MNQEEALRAKLKGLPRDHDPTPYTVKVLDRRGNLLTRRYVRASSQARAELLGYIVNKYIFRIKLTFSASARIGI